MKIKGLLLLGILASINAACDDDNKTDVNPEVAMQNYAQAICQFRIDCCEEGFTLQECVDAAYADISHVPDGATINGSAFVDCLEAATDNFTAGCTGSFEMWISECRIVSVYTGSRAAGEPCENDASCLSGHYCNWDTDKCVKQGGLDEQCDGGFDYPCISGLVCLDGTCSNPTPIGGACDYPYQCGTDTDHTVTCINHICDEKLDNGDDCQVYQDSDCLSGYCDSTTSKCADMPAENSCDWYGGE
ncbi:hypothetical protein KKF34_06850 [Myxococcota bacterium]|nr:hypothetical protein [Myxococcota bacterium]MBU1382420.1 hypothetical protein [Myxococcota bacterium]MBU1496579.1 hypothetical protein [Myxococcota bacterium]